MGLRLLLALILTAAATAQSPRLRVEEGKLDSDGLPVGDGRVCLIDAPFTCYAMSSGHNGTVQYDFGLEPHAKAIARQGDGPWLLFDATFSGGGSGTLTRYNILRSEGTYLVNVLHDADLTQQSEHAIWRLPEISSYPLWVSADFIWDFDKAETHFSRHRYCIRVQRYDPKEREYFTILKYGTSRHYKGLDEADDIHVLGPERTNILRRLRKLKH